MTNKTLAMSIRAKKLAVLMRSARQKAGKTPQECAQALGIPLEEFESYELGEGSPSLPQVELLAYSLNTPLEYFYGNHSVIEDKRLSLDYDPERLLLLRQRMVGVMLRKARLESGLSLDAAAQETGLTVDQLEGYELGEDSIPLPKLESLAGLYGRSLKDFQDRNGPVGQWIRQQAVARDILDMPPELLAFVCLPVNQPYIELAQRLSEMSVEKLRAVAEGLLEITL
jgi:transcriptional regulator with XRE-family HTH domain